MSGAARSRVVRVHGSASFAAMFLLASFWTSTVVSELFFGWDVVGAVKTGILVAIPFLVLALVTAGASGRQLVPKAARGLPQRKLQRLKIVAANGLCCLVPCAVALWWMATRGEPSVLFHVVQAVELTAGAVNLTLIGLNIRDGRRMRRGPTASSPSLRCGPRAGRHPSPSQGA